MIPAVISRAEARVAGSTRYFTGKPCKWGHICERQTKSGHCVICWRLHVTARRKRRGRTDRDTPEKRVAWNNRQYKRRTSTVAGQIINRLRALIHYGLRGAIKPDSTLALLGCSPQFLETRFEVLMQGYPNSMVLSDRGSWQIDHIKPVSSFDHSYPEQIRACWHWSNLQPLPPEVNLAKGGVVR